ncbi:hypothetical protein B0H11DRAFT_2248308 [Mycena galericulata]|nr:hypothetical protein B0H11DRAFT_2248308 [Mycena galericulata]
MAAAADSDSFCIISTVLGARHLEERRQSHKERASAGLAPPPTPSFRTPASAPPVPARRVHPSHKATPSISAPCASGGLNSTARILRQAHLLCAPLRLFGRIIPFLPSSLIHSHGMQASVPETTRQRAALPASQKTAGKADARETWPIGGRAPGSHSVVNGMVVGQSIVFPEMLLLRNVGRPVPRALRNTRTLLGIVSFLP